MPALTESYSAPLSDYPGAFTRRRRLSRAGHWVGTGLLQSGMVLTRGLRARRANYLRRSGAARVIQRRFRQGRRIRRPVNVGGRGVTSEHDRQFIYRKKSMPSYKKRQWRRFKGKVHAVAEKSLGSRTVVFNKKGLVFSNTTLNDQLVGSVALYPYDSPTQDHLQDLKLISGYENAGDPTAASGINVQDSTKFIFQSAVLDITIRNTSDFNNEALNGEATLEVDIYECTANRYFRDGTAASGNLQDFFGNAAGDMEEIGGAGTALSILKRGATPFDITYALSRGKIKILKKTKMFIRNSQTATYQYRDPKRRVFSQDFMENGIGPNMRKNTHWILIIAKVVPGITVGATAGGETRERLTIGCTRKYFYKIEGANDDRTRFVSQ